MNVLAIETATAACAVGVASSEGEWVEVLEGERRHSEALTPTIERLLADARLDVTDLERIVVDRGPGLFTGLRVGVATALGLVLALRAELVEVTSLELLALGAARLGVRGTLLALVDGRRGELFAQSFDLDETVRAREAPMLTTAGAFVERWRGQALSVTGDGAARYQGELAVLERAEHLVQRVPPVTEALRVAPSRPTVRTSEPLYLRDADAVANFATRERP